MSLFRELCRRNVIRVVAVYAASSWLVFQIFDLVHESSTGPDWAMQILMLTMAAGLPIVAIAAWFIELTPDGFRLVKNVDPEKSIAQQTGHQLTRGIAVILSMAVVLYLTDKFRDETFFASDKSDTEIEEPIDNGR